MNTPGITSSTIRLGTFLDLSGRLAPIGIRVLAGLQACLERVNVEGGIYGRRLELIALDDHFDPDQTVTLTRRLVEVDRVFALVGAVGMPTNKAVLPYLVERGVPVVAPFTGWSLLSIPPKRNYFALSVNFVVEGTLLARYALENLNVNRIAIYNSAEDFGQEGARGFQDELTAHGVSPVHIELGWEESLAPSAVVKRLQAAQPDSVLLYARFDQAAELLREADRQGFHPQWLGSHTLYDPVLFERAGTRATEGVIVSQPYLDPMGTDPNVVCYRRDLAEFAPEITPGGYSVAGYSGMCLAVEGMIRAGEHLDRDSFIAALETLDNWSGGLVTGLSYNRHNHRGIRRLSMAQAVNGEWITEKRTMALRDRLLNVTAPLATQLSILNRQAMEQLGKERIRQKAIDVARQCAIFIDRSPGWNWNDFEVNEEFRRIAMQSIGQKGYTEIHGPAPEPIMRLHPNPALIHVDLRETDRPTRFPDWWKLYQYSLANNGQEGGGFYNWEDADGIVRQKYQYSVPIEGTRYILSATTYLDEFFQPVAETEQAIRRVTDDLTAEIVRQLLDPIQQVMEGVDRVSEGDLDYTIDFALAEEAQGLAQAFNRMTHNLRVLSEQWAELSRELEARVSERTLQLGETNRQLELSNLSLQEINRQLTEARAVSERARREAEEANRLKSRFLSNISHELRTPLNAVMNYSTLLLLGKEGPLSEGGSDSLERIRDAGKHLLGLLNDMLDLADIEGGVVEFYREETDLTELIRSVMATAVGLTRDKQIEIRRDLPDLLPPVWIDRTRVRQVLLSLLANAAKFTERGSITVSARQVGDLVRVGIADTGSGIPEANQERIFDSKLGVERAELPGAGFGLATSRQLIELQGGSMWVSSHVGQGSTFYFTVPITDLGEPVPPNDGKLNGQTKNEQLVFVIDTDRRTYRCLADPLQTHGFRAVGLSDPSLIAGKVAHFHPAAVILDPWQVAGADYLIRKLQQNWSHVPLLFAAYHTSEVGEIQSLSDGASGVGPSKFAQDAFIEHVLGWVHENTSRVA